MAREMNTDLSEPGLQSNFCSSLVEKDMATEEVGSTIKCESDEQAVEEQGDYCPRTSCYNYYYPGYEGSYLNASSGSYTDSSYVGDAANRIAATCGRVKSALGSDKSLKTKGFNNSTETNRTPDKNSSCLPQNMKMQQSTASHKPYKSIIPQPIKPLRRLGFGYQSSGFMKGFQPAGKFSSYTNCNQGLFVRDTPLNYRPDVRVWSGNDISKSREKSNSQGEFDTTNELTCGPRGLSKSNPVNSSTEDEQLGLSSARRDEYNLEDFQTEYDNAKFYVIKSFSEYDIHKSIKYSVWSSTRNGNNKLDAAFHYAEGKTSEAGKKCPIFLFYSVNRSGQFVGVAEMIGMVDFNKTMDFWQLDKWNGFFPLKWHIIKDIPNSQLRHIILENNYNREVTYTRDTQEIGLEQGLEMLKIFKNYSAKTSLLDDFNFYEKREKLLTTQRNSKPASQTEIYNRYDIPRHFKEGDKVAEEGFGTGSNLSYQKSLVNLTHKLSLKSPPMESGGVMMK